MLLGLRRNLFREPKQGFYPWVLFALGLLNFTLLFSFIPLLNENPFFWPLLIPVATFAMGGPVAVLCGLAEVLPKNRVTAAGALRTAAFVIVLVGLPTFVVVFLVSFAGFAGLF
jgi:hypothetical protein